MAKTLTCTLVGFRHHAWQGDTLDERLGQCEGKRVVLMHDEYNDRNEEATAAYIDTSMVGYVSNDECHVTATYCEHSLDGILVGRIKTVDVANRRMQAEVLVDDNVRIDEPTGRSAFDEWEQEHRNLPVMGVDDDERRLRMLQRDIIYLLREDNALDPILRADLETYERLMPFDVSREATMSRRCIADMMSRSSHEEVAAWGRRLDIRITQMGSPEACAQLAEYFCGILPTRSVFREMARRHAHADLMRIESSLRAFPYDLYNEYQVSKTDFVSKLYYRQVPARPLRRFVSGLLLTEHLRGRLSAVGQQQRTIREAVAYAETIATYATNQWQGSTRQLWLRIASDNVARLMELNGAKNTTFNRRMVCQVIGFLIAKGVYRSDITQSQYGKILQHDGKDMRTSVNKALTDEDELRACIADIMADIAAK